METCFKILQLKFDQKLTNRCIALTLQSVHQQFLRCSPALKPRLSHGPSLKQYPMMPLKSASSRPNVPLHQNWWYLTCFTSILR